MFNCVFKLFEGNSRFAHDEVYLNFEPRISIIEDMI